jgi:hypothetical protein
MFLLAAAGAVVVTGSLTSCKTPVTLENRRDLYNPQKVMGPYTRMLRDGIPQPQPVTGTAPVGDGKAVIR